MGALITQHLEHADVIGFAAGFFEDGARVRYDDRVGGDDDGRVGERHRGELGLGECGLVDGEAFLVRCLEDVLEGAEGFGDVFGVCGGQDLEVCEADLGEEGRRVSGYVVVWWKDWRGDGEIYLGE
jgi:hypothetical protein